MNRRVYGALIVAPALAACRSPTQIEVTIGTDFGCANVTDTTFRSGELVAIESAPPTTETALRNDECATHRNRSPYAATTSANLKVYGPFVTDGTPETAPAIMADGTLVVATETNTIEAFRADGSFKWRYTDDAGTANFYAMPIIAADGTIRAYDSTSDLNFYVVIDATSGALVSRNTTNTGNVSGGLAVVSGGTQYVINDDSSQLTAMSASGSILWFGTNEDNNQVIPTVAHDHTVISGGGSTLNATYPDGGGRWSIPTPGGGTYEGLAISTDDSVRAYAVESNVMYSIDLATHATNWTAVMDSGTSDEINGYSIADDGTTYVGTQSNGIVSVDGAGHKGKTFGSRCNQPVIDAAGTLVAWCDGNIVALSPDLATTYWSVQAPTAPETFTIIWETPVIGPSGLVYITIELGQGLPDGGDLRALYAIGP